MSEVPYVLMVACGVCQARLAVGDSCPHVRGVELTDRILVVSQTEPHPWEVQAFQALST